MKETASSKPKSANVENFKARQRKVIATRAEDVIEDIESQRDLIKSLEEDLDFANYEGTRREMDELEEALLDAYEELALFEEESEKFMTTSFSQNRIRKQ